MPRKPKIIKPIPGVTFEELVKLAVKDVKKRRKKKPRKKYSDPPRT